MTFSFSQGQPTPSCKHGILVMHYQMTFSFSRCRQLLPAGSFSPALPEMTFSSKRGSQLRPENIFIEFYSCTNKDDPILSHRGSQLLPSNMEF
jgi:hypothetical protein